MIRRLTVCCIAALAAASGSRAQGSLSVQGLGYPPGQISTRAEGMGGAIAEVDALSATNPASITSIAATSLYFQYDPEFRKVSASGATARTTTARFPVIGLILPAGTRFTVGVSSSTLVDRSSETESRRVRRIDTTNVTVTENVKALGAINDIRLALGWVARNNFQIGFGAHAFTGSNRLSLSQIFPDTAKFTNVRQQSRVSYTGAAASAGIQWQPSKILTLGVAGRKGGRMTAESNDTVLGRGNVPDHFAASASYAGLGDATLAVRVAHDSWSSLKPLTSSAIRAVDAWDMGVGAEAGGPRVLDRLLMLRAGVRARTLPFAVSGTDVREISVGGGVGAQLARNRASFDMGVQRASRSGGGSTRETAWVLSFGLRVTP